MQWGKRHQPLKSIKNIVINHQGGHALWTTVNDTVADGDHIAKCLFAAEPIQNDMHSTCVISFTNFISLLLRIPLSFDGEDTTPPQSLRLTRGDQS